LTVQQFDNIYNKEITKRYAKREIQRLSKKGRKRDMGAGRPFKLDLENRFLMLLVYYRLYITYTLAGFLFDLDQSNVCRIYKRLNIEYGKAMYTNSVENIQQNKEAKNTQRSRETFSRLSCFYRFHRTADSKTCR
jgi:hypothetical protein